VWPQEQNPDRTSWFDPYGPGWGGAPLLVAPNPDVPWSPIGGPVSAISDQFAQLCKASIHEKLIFGMAETITPGLAHRSVQGAVDMFLARYGAPV
jgi:hypothetical protein